MDTVNTNTQAPEAPMDTNTRIEDTQAKIRNLDGQIDRTYCAVHSGTTGARQKLSWLKRQRSFAFSDLRDMRARLAEESS
jgi:hypothetical protein